MEKRMRPLLTMGLALALAGCGGGEEAANNSAAPTPTPTPGPMLGGVDLDKPIRATGSAPYWAIYIAPGTIAFADAPATSPTDFYPISPKLAGDTARFETQTPDAEPVTITLTAKACVAGKEMLPLGAEVRIGSRTLKGCAGPGAYDWAARKASPTPSPSPAKAK
jgi:uncharacterized membrane protein